MGSKQCSVVGLREREECLSVEASSPIIERKTSVDFPHYPQREETRERSIFHHVTLLCEERETMESLCEATGALFLFVSYGAPTH